MSSRRELANAVRALSMDAVQKANSGHPGAPMGMADIAEVLWNDYLKHNPANPRWPNRDRFVLSNGHGSMLLYSLLHLSGYDVSIDELRNFRQFGQRTAGHPEYEPEMGVETTTGPLGQGVTNAVGMALAEKMLASAFNGLLLGILVIMLTYRGGVIELPKNVMEHDIEIMRIAIALCMIVFGTGVILNLFNGGAAVFLPKEVPIFLLLAYVGYLYFVSRGHTETTLRARGMRARAGKPPSCWASSASSSAPSSSPGPRSTWSTGSTSTSL